MVICTFIGKYRRLFHFGATYISLHPHPATLRSTWWKQTLPLYNKLKEERKKSEKCSPEIYIQVQINLISL